MDNRIEHPIEVIDLSKSFTDVKHASVIELLRRRAPQKQVLDGISFEVGEGQLLGVMGRNGAGKSTLLRLMGGVYQPDEGVIAIRGDIAAIFEMGIFLDQNMTGTEYCRDYFNFVDGHGDADELIRSIREFTELGDFFDQPIRTYSAGMQAKLLFGVATALPADIFLIDEVLVVGDEYFQGRAWKRLVKMLEQGTTGVIVSHDWRSILRLCENCMILKDGKVDFLGSSYDAVKRYLDIRPVTSPEIYIRDRDHLLSHTFEAENGKPYQFDINLRVEEPPPGGELAVLLSFERFIPGKGWNLAASCGTGVNVAAPSDLAVHFAIPCMELAPGDYFQMVSVALPPKPGSKSFARIYEELSWLRGSPVRLRVRGKNPAGALLERRLLWQTSSI